MLGKLTGHSVKRPPKKCTECRKPLTHPPNVKWKDRREHRCECERCVHNILDGDRKPWVCDECRARWHKYRQKEEES